MVMLFWYMLVWTNNGSYNAYHGSTYGSYQLPYPLVNVYIAIEAMAQSK